MVCSILFINTTLPSIIDVDEEDGRDDMSVDFDDDHAVDENMIEEAPSDDEQIQGDLEIPLEEGAYFDYEHGDADIILEEEAFPDEEMHDVADTPPGSEHTSDNDQPREMNAVTEDSNEMPGVSEAQKLARRNTSEFHPILTGTLNILIMILFVTCAPSQDYGAMQMGLSSLQTHHHHPRQQRKTGVHIVINSNSRLQISYFDGLQCLKVKLINL